MARSAALFAAGFRVVFESAVLVYENDQLTVYEAQAADGKVIDLSSGVEMGGSINLQNTGGIYNEIAYFVECVENGTAPEIITPEQSFISLKILLTELESAKYREILPV